MKYCIAVQEILRRVVVVEAESLAEAECTVQEAYDAGEIVLGADDLVTDPVSGERCNIIEADWHDKDAVEEMEVDYGLSE